MRPPPTMMTSRTDSLKMASFLNRRLILRGEPTTRTSSSARKTNFDVGMKASPSRTIAATSVPSPKAPW